ncbi:MAG: ABC transporter permease [Chitinophagales bacterium]|jgi:phospholipid/cholesterol/gamma-HCH transport system permease protein|nr:ABC transporter permease [Chitinophagales bacterium]
MGFLHDIGKYILMISSMFTRPENLSMYAKETMRQVYQIGIGSVLIIAIVSTFVGAVTAVQFSYQLLDIGLIPMWWMGIIVRDSLILEMAPTICALLLAGKVGSNIASELGSMRVTEQIDALEIMGVNTTAYLIGPKILGGLIIVPFLIIMAVGLGIIGGGIAGVLGDFFSTADYVRGLQDGHEAFYIVIMLIKCYVFAFIITSVACYQGFYVKGGALEIGNASTRAVVNSSIVIIIANFLIAFLLL